MLGYFQSLNDLTKNKNSPQSEILQITGGEDMKYKGVSVIKNKTCKTWYARYRKNGKQFYISAKTQKECYNKLKKALSKKDKEIKEQKKLVKKEKILTLGKWFDKWLELYKKDVKKTTKQDYYKSFKYLEILKDKALDKITSIEILEILNTIEHSRRKQIVYELANSLFEKAHLNELITKNPVKIIEKPKHKKINGNAFSNEDEQILESELIKYNLDMFLICLYQGLRKGEVLALTGEDINLKNRTLTINKAISTNNELVDTKNEYSNRTIPIFDKTIPILKKYENTQGRLFNITYYGCEKKFKKILTANFPKTKYSMHSLRHTFITRCQEANIPLHIIQRWVGHNIGSDVTNRVYTHTRENAELENIELYNKYFK